MPKETSFTSGDPNGTLLFSPSRIPNHQRDDISPLKLWEAHSYQLSVESTAAPEQNSEEGHPLQGVLQSDPALKGPGTRTISLDEKVAPDAALPSPQKRTFRGLDFSDTLHPPGEFGSCFRCDGISNLLHSSLCTWNGCRAQLLQHRKGVRVSPLSWKQLNLKHCICTLGKEYPARGTVTGQMLNCWNRTELANMGQTQQRDDQNTSAQAVKCLQA